MFDTEIRGQMAMLMGGRAAEELTCSQACSPKLAPVARAGPLEYSGFACFGSKGTRV